MEIDSLILNFIIESEEDDFLRVDGFDDCVIGSCEKDHHLVLVYSIDAIVDKIADDDNISYEEAEEYFYYNIAYQRLGPKTPMFVNMYKSGKKVMETKSNGKIGIIL
jgi:hypothetical protein